MFKSRKRREAEQKEKEAFEAELAQEEADSLRVGEMRLCKEWSDEEATWAYRLYRWTVRDHTLRPFRCYYGWTLKAESTSLAWATRQAKHYGVEIEGRDNA